MEQFLQVGVISSTHGLRGEVKVFPTTDDAARFQTLKNVVLDTGREKLDLEIQSVRFFKQFVIVKFKGIDNINDIEMLKRASHSFAVENAREEVKEVANFIAPSYKEDGVLQVLKAVLRGELA